MARSFNLTAELNLRGPANIRNVIGDIRRQLGNITVDITPRINQAAIRNITALNGNLGQLNTTLNATATSANNAATAIQNLSRAVASIRGTNINQTINSAANSVQTLTTNANTASTGLQQAATRMEEFGRQSALAVRRFAAFSIVTSTIYGFINAVNKGIGAFIEFDKEFVRLQQVTDSSAKDLKSLANEITRLSTGLGVASTDLTTVSVTLAQAGLSARETKTALQALARSALAPSFDNLNDTVEGSIALMRQFGIGANELEAALGSVNSVAAKFAVEASDLIVAIQRTGGVFASASRGVSEGKDALNEFLAVFTSIRQTTRESAETIATGLRTIFTRIQRQDTIDALKLLGIQLRDTQGQFVGAFEAVRRLSEGLSRIDPRSREFAAISEELGGFRQIGKVIPLIQQFAVAQQALKVAQEGQGSLAADAATAQLSLANQIAKVREEFLALIRSIGESDSFRSFVRLSLDLASALIKLADSAKTVLPALTAIAAFKGISALTQFGRGFGRGFAGPRGYASGGYVPGTGNRDTVPAMLTPGEFVIRKKAVESIGVSNLQSLNKKGAGGSIRKFANGGLATAPMVDDILQAPGSILPKPSAAIAAIIRAGGGAIDIDRTLKRTIGDKAYGMAKTPGQQSAALDKYFRDPVTRLRDVKTSPLTQFGKELQMAIKAKQINPSKLSIISKSMRTPGVAEYLSQLFGIPVGNMIFTQGASKAPALESMRSKGPRAGRIAQKLAFGGLVQRFTDGKDVKKIPKYAEPERVSAALSKSSARTFGLAGLLGEAGKESYFNQTLVATPDGMDPVPVNIRVGTVSQNDPKLSTQVDEYLKKSFKQAIISTTKFLSTKLKSTSTKTNNLDEIVENSGYQQVAGSVFEGALSNLGAPFFQKTQFTKALDFPKGLGQAAEFFKIPMDAPTDATRTVGSGGKGPGRMIGQIERYLEAEAKGLYAGKVPVPLSGVEKGLLSSFPSTGFKQSLTQALTPATIAKIEARFGKIALKAKRSFLTRVQLDPSDPLKGEIERQLSRYSPTRQNSGGNIKKFASGGSSSDTVPALLTPGEFVINKKAAASLGSSRLNQLNRADKIQGFNKGGIVQRFANGGMPTSLTSAFSGISPKETARLSKSIMGNINAWNQLESLISNLPADQMLKAMRIFASSLENGATDIDAAAIKAADLAVSSNTGATRSPKKGVLQQTAGVSESRTQGTINVGGQTRTFSSDPNYAKPQGFAASQTRLNQIAANPQQYQRGANIAATRTTAGGRMGGQVGLSGAAQQKLAMGGFNPSIFAKLGTAVSQGATSVSQFAASVKSAPLATFNASLKQAGSGLAQVGKMGLGAAGRGASQAISGIGGGAIGLGKKALGVNGLQSLLPAFMQKGGVAGVAQRAAAAPGGGGMGGMGAMALTMAGGVGVDVLSKAFGGEDTEAGRTVSAVGSSTLNMAATGAMIGSVIPGLGTAFGGAIGAVAGFTMGMFEAQKANEEYAKAQKQAASEAAMEKSGAAISKFAETGKESDRAAAVSAFKEAAVKEQEFGETTKRERRGWGGAALNVLSLGMAGYKDENLGDFAKRKAGTQKAGAEQAEQFLAASMMQSGKTFAELSKSMKPEDFMPFARNIAEADERYVAVQELRNAEIQKAIAAGDTDRANQLEKDKNAELDALASTLAERKMAEQSAVIEAQRAAKASAAISMALQSSAMTLESAFDKMGQILNSASFGISESLETGAEIFSGQVSLVSSRFDKIANVLENPEAFSLETRQRASAEAGAILGPSGQNMARMAEFGRTAVSQTTESALRVERMGGDSGAVLASIKQNLTRQIEESFGKGTPLAEQALANLEEELKKASDEVAKSGGQLDVAAVIEKAAGPLVKAGESAGKQLANANKLVSDALKAMAETAQQYNKLQQQQIKRTSALAGMQAGSALKEREALGLSVSVGDRARARDASTIAGMGMTAGTTLSAGSIIGRRQQLTQTQSELKERTERLSAQAPTSAKAARELVYFQSQLALVNSQLENTDQALENLPQSLEESIGDVVGEMQKRVSQLEARKEAGAGFAEKLITSTPKELAELNNTYALLNNTLQGNITTINQSQSAQKAYFEALRNGKTRQEAMADAQGAFADENKKALSLFQELSQVAGLQGADMDRMRADLIENFARASGQGNNRMIQMAVRQLRMDPAQRAAQDPQLQALQAQAAALREEQVRAVEAANKIDRDKQAELLTRVIEEIIKQLSGVELKVDVAGISQTIEERAPQNRQRGGIIYASGGQLINFKPKGTDTVPAMLTPGEFVVNRKATQKNLGLLTSINNGSKGYSQGGVVYLQGGGLAGEIAQKNVQDIVQQFSDYRRRGIRFYRKGTSGLSILDRNNQVISDINKLREFDPLLESAKLDKQAAKYRYNAPNAQERDAENPGAGSDFISEALMDKIAQKFILKQQRLSMQAIRGNTQAQGMSIVSAVLNEIAKYPNIFEIANPSAFISEAELNAAFDPARFNKWLTSLDNEDKKRNALTAISDRHDYVDRILTNNKDGLAAISRLKTKGSNTDLNNITRAKNVVNSQISAATSEANLLDKLENLQTFNNLLPKGQERFQQTFFNPADIPRSPLQFVGQPFSRGGVVYANKGQLIDFQPKGTDTIPAMLTPGEFVVNRKASRKNAGLLQAINSGNYNNGGLVYLQQGGANTYEEQQRLKREAYQQQKAMKAAAYQARTGMLMTGPSPAPVAAQPRPQQQNNPANNNPNEIKLSREAQNFITTFDTKIENFGKYIASFGKYIDNLAGISLPEKIDFNFNAAPLEVRITGSSVLESMSEGIQKMVASEINKEMNRIWGQTDGEIGKRPN